MTITHGDDNNLVLSGFTGGISLRKDTAVDFVEGEVFSLSFDGNSTQVVKYEEGTNEPKGIIQKDSREGSDIVQVYSNGGTSFRFNLVVFWNGTAYVDLTNLTDTAGEIAKLQNENIFFVEGTD